jgi:hypothetical protein
VPRPSQRAFEEMSKKVEASASPPKAGGVAKYSMVDFTAAVKFAADLQYHVDVREVPKLSQQAGQDRSQGFAATGGIHLAAGESHCLPE